MSVAGAQEGHSADSTVCGDKAEEDIVDDADNDTPAMKRDSAPLTGKSEADDSSVMCVPVENGSPVPDIVVAVFDEYGNRAAPTPGEEWTFRVESNDVAEGKPLNDGDAGGSGALLHTPRSCLTLGLLLA